MSERNHAWDRALAKLADLHEDEVAKLYLEECLAIAERANENLAAELKKAHEKNPEGVDVPALQETVKLLTKAQVPA
jgi:hypothetical protein